MIKIKIVIITFLILFLNTSLCSQETKEDDHVEEVRSLTLFFEFMLNSIGSENTPQTDKETIINESFSKAFESELVQIEDDLLEERRVITNKDVQAYLRDVDFFFQHITFQFDSLEIALSEKPSGESFYLVAYESNMNGTTLEGNPIKRSENRFLEVNIDQTSGELKIASVYTSKVSREQELKEWYANLSFGWINVFDQYVSYDSITTEVLFKMADIDSINLSNNQFLSNIRPLAALKNLQYLNISNTKIEDLSPVRYAKSIKTIIADNTPIEEISVLQYLDEIRYLSFRNANLERIEPIKNLSRLESLDLSETGIIDFHPLSDLSNLKYLNLGGTDFNKIELLKNVQSLQYLNVSRSKITDLNSISELRFLETLDASGTGLESLNGLEKHPTLRLLNISDTFVDSLEPVEDVKRLEKIEADLSDIPPDAASMFMDKHPSVVVIVNSKELQSWWENLPASWKSKFSVYHESPSPSNEELLRMTKMDSLDVSDLRANNLQPLVEMRKLKFLNISNSSFDSFDFTANMSDLQALIAENTSAKSTQGLEKNVQLQSINLKNSLIEEIGSIQSLNKVNYLNLDYTSIPKRTIKELIQSKTDVLVIWRTTELKDWWNALDPVWKDAFKLSNPSVEELHRLTHRRSLSISDVPIRDFSALSAFIQLQELTLDKAGVLSFSGLSDHTELRKISCTNGPLQSVKGLNGLTQIEELNISNTPIENLEDIVTTSSIKTLNCSGTNIKKLNGIEPIETIEYIDISNTRVFRLDRLEGMRNLKELVCYNTKLREFEVAKYKEKFPSVKVIYY